MGLIDIEKRGRKLLLASGALVLFAVGSGCQSKLYDDNKALREQNRELQSAVDERSRIAREDVPLTPPETPKPTAPPKPEAAYVPPTPPATPPSVPSAPTAPAAGPTDLGGDVTFNPIDGTTTVNFLGDALFDSGKAMVKTTAKASLDKMVAALKAQYSGKTIKVQGYSDSDPIIHSKWKSNQELSEARAKAVRDYLVLKGVKATLVSSEGFGDAKPKSPTDKSKNRRVEIVVLTN